MTTTADLAQAARHTAETNPNLRPAALCAAIVLDYAQTPEGAQRMLQTANLRDTTKQAAIDLIDQLTTETTQ